MASMIIQAFGVPTPAIEYILLTIQRMRFYLCTGYGDSEGYAGGSQKGEDDPVRTQGMCQGNGASSAAWLVTSIPMIRAHSWKGHGAHFIAPISGRSCHLSGGIFVGDTDLFHLDMQQVETVMEAHDRLQESVFNWGKLLLAPGGALKSEKCSFHLLSFQWKADGTWVYETNKTNANLAIGVPMADGSVEEIEHLPCNRALKTLGLLTCPSGSNSTALDRMHLQVQEWVDRVLTSTLSHCNMWFMIDYQFWPRLGFGICNNLATWKELKSCLQRVYWQLIGRRGVHHSAPVGLHQLDKGFYGIGCPTRG
jgi:hypothetical protein